MEHLRENTLSQQTVARRIGEWLEPTTSRMEVPAAGDFLSGFARAVVQTLSPSSVRGFFRELDANDRVLSRLGWALLLAVPVFAALAMFVPATVGTTAVNPWIKPIKFSMSFHKSAIDGLADTQVAAHAGSSRDCDERWSGNPEPGSAGVAQRLPTFRAFAVGHFPCPDDQQHGHG